MLSTIDVFGGTFQVLDRTHTPTNSRKLQKTPLPTIDDVPQELPQRVREMVFDEMVRQDTSSQRWPGRSFGFDGPDRLHAEWRVWVSDPTVGMARCSLRQWSYIYLMLLATAETGRAA